MELDVEYLVRAAVMLLDQEDSLPTEDKLRQVAQQVGLMSPATDVELIYRRLEEVIDVQVDRPVVLVKDHVPWLSAKRAATKWHFWDRYQHYLETNKGFEPAVVRRLDQVTDEILDLTADPQTEGPWDRRGLVVGQVQSGKTANYLALIAKSIDAGFRVIVVLAGAHNDLRAQTQLRLDEGILGWDTHVDRDRPGEGTGAAHRIGVGELNGFPLYHIIPKTTSAENGDFGKAQAKVIQPLGKDPVVLVIKKNKSVLNNLIEWLSALNAVQAADGRQVIPDHPLLVIDDEADHYSVNTANAKGGQPDEEVEPTTINRLLREVLRRFEKSVYIGYTATAFANIFINHNTEESGFGEDLFPRSFIINLKAPSNYMGPTRVFGLDFEDEHVEALPILRDVGDSQDWLPTRHKNGHVPGPVIPPSLKEAIHAFVLVCAVRRARGHTDVHNSMLIHVTRFNSVQGVVREQVTAELLRLRRNITYGAGDGRDLVEGLKELYERDFRTTSESMTPAGRSGNLHLNSWEEVQQHLKEAVNRIEVRGINGVARDALDYFDHRPTGLNVIAVGGDKLSRGLTLEGLSVSYYLRPARAYDTLLQMGRWFGFRPGYEDLCRLYTTTGLRGWYEDITVANTELLKDFDRMVEIKATPEQFGLRVRTHPDGLLVSAASKVQEGQKVRLNFSGDLAETVVFDRDIGTRDQNLAVLGSLIGEIHGGNITPGRDGNWTYDGVDGEVVARFLAAAQTSARAVRARTDLLAQYVENRIKVGELLRWTVQIVSSTAKTAKPYQVGDLDVNLIVRSGSFERDSERESADQKSDLVHYRIRRLLSPRDLRTGLSSSQIAEAFGKSCAQATQDGKPAPDEPTAPSLRRVRSPLEGLLLIYLLDPRPEKGLEGLTLPDARDGDLPYLGLGVSFPYTDDLQASAEYLVTKTFQQLEMGQ
jgi:hypothetical protein